MDLDLRLIVEWPNHTKLPVRLSASATGADLIGLLHFCLRDDTILALIANGICIRLRETLLTQHIQSDCLIKVVRISPNFDFPMSSDEELDEFEVLPPSLQAEALRIADLQMALIDGAPQCGAFYRRYLMEIESEDPIPEPEPTVLSANAEIREDPLPVWPSGMMDQTSSRDCGEGECETHLTKSRPPKSGWSW
jgi:hypothetical protein